MSLPQEATTTGPLRLLGMNHEPNATAWKMGDLVIHDDDAKRSDMLMKVLSRIASGPNKGKFRTRYAYPEHQPKSWRTKVWVNGAEKLHDPKRFGIDTTRRPQDRFSRDLDGPRLAQGTVARIESGAERFLRTGAAQQIYARIKKSSKYRKQTESGEFFPVTIGSGHSWDYIVRGNNNQYRVRDLAFYVQVGGQFVPLS